MLDPIGSRLPYLFGWDESAPPIPGRPVQRKPLQTVWPFVV